MNSSPPGPIPFLHSLVRVQAGEKAGWFAPMELGEASPQYISYAIPVDTSRRCFDNYQCELVSSGSEAKKVEVASLNRRSAGSFELQIGGTKVWFLLRAGAEERRRLPYAGRLKHEDFRHLFVEIEPEDPGILDDLYEQEGIFVIGCEPFLHYQQASEAG